jgi:hypothetical protein
MWRSHKVVAQVEAKVRSLDPYPSHLDGQEKTMSVVQDILLADSPERLRLQELHRLQLRQEGQLLSLKEPRLNCVKAFSVSIAPQLYALLADTSTEGDDDAERKTQAEVLLHAYNRELERRRLAAGAQGLLISDDGNMPL